MWSERLMYRGSLWLLLIFAMGSEALQDPTPSAGLGQHHLGSFDCPIPVGPQDCLEQDPRKFWWRSIAGPSKPRLRGGEGDTDAEAEEEITFPTASADATKEVEAVEEKPALDLRSWDPSYQQGKPTVWAAAKFGDFKEMRDALDEGGELGSMDEQDGELKTALHHAVSASSIECIDELLSRGASIDAVDEYGWTPIHAAASVGNIEVFKLLMEAANQKGKLEQMINVESCSNQLTVPLHHIAGKKHMELLQYVLATFKDIINLDARDSNGCTPCMRAIASGCLPAVEVLAMHGADLNISDDNGNTTLHLACENGDEEMIGWLINRGADPISPNNDGVQPVDHLDFEKAKRVSRVYNEYRRKVGMKHRSDSEQERVEDGAFDEAMKIPCPPAMSFSDNKEGGDPADDRGDGGEGGQDSSESESGRMKTKVWLPTEMM